MKVQDSCEQGQTRLPWQFSLRAMVSLVLVLSILFAIVCQFPRFTGFAILMALLLLIPRMIMASFQWLLDRLGMAIDDHWLDESRERNSSIIDRLTRSFAWLGLWQSEKAPSLILGLATALVYSLALVQLWPAVREIGLSIALIGVQTVGQSWDFLVRDGPITFFNRSYWERLSRWETYSLGRWWLLFGSIVVLWLIVTLPLSRGFKVQRVTHTLARFLAFAPWLIVVEFSFLVGIWIQTPNVVPEPSTGFVAGIFSWNLWHWDCWLNREWLVRGALPTFVISWVFFVNVLRWRWYFAVVAAIALIPIAVTLSIACTVAYQNGLPPVWPWSNV